MKLDNDIYLSLKNLRIDRLLKKLNWITILYRIVERVDTHVYKLDTPLEIHLVFHISLLRSRDNNSLLSQHVYYIENLSIKVNNYNQYEVELILEYRRLEKRY